MLAKYRIEAKWIAITILTLLLLVYISRTEAMNGLQDSMQDLMNWVANEEGLVGGSIGLFVMALIANTSLLVQVPYTVPLMNIALVSDSLLKVLILSIATGAGAGLGEINSYMIARGLTAPIGAPEDSRLFRWIKRTITEHPRSIPLLVFVGAGTPMPDDLIIWPLALVRYPVRKILLPMFIGKVIHNFFFALIAFYGVEMLNAEDTTVRVDLSIGILLVFIIFILYQIEKARHARREQESTPATD